MDKISPEQNKGIKKSFVDEMVFQMGKVYGIRELEKMLGIDSIKQIYPDKTITATYGETQFLESYFKKAGKLEYNEKIAKQVCIEKLCSDLGIKSLDDLREPYTEVRRKLKQKAAIVPKKEKTTISASEKKIINKNTTKDPELDVQKELESISNLTQTLTQAYIQYKNAETNHKTAEEYCQKTKSDYGLAKGALAKLISEAKAKDLNVTIIGKLEKILSIESMPKLKKASVKKKIS